MTQTPRRCASQPCHPNRGLIEIRLEILILIRLLLVSLRGLVLVVTALETRARGSDRIDCLSYREPGTITGAGSYPELAFFFFRLSAMGLARLEAPSGATFRSAPRTVYHPAAP